MNHHYNDIRERISEPPIWWDERAVPRYCQFSPAAKANIYADEVALVEIRCQGCGMPFKVAFSMSRMDRMIYHTRSLTEQIRDGSLHYGDPPNAGCCSSGPVMNCHDIRVLEFWLQERFDWIRQPELEVSLEERSAVGSGPLEPPKG